MLNKFLGPTVTEVPMVVDNKLEVDWKIELVLYQLVQVFGVHVAQPAADADIEAVGGLVKKNTSTGDERIVVFLVEYRRSVAFASRSCEAWR